VAARPAGQAEFIAAGYAAWNCGDASCDANFWSACDGVAHDVKLKRWIRSRARFAIQPFLVPARQGQ